MLLALAASEAATFTVTSAADSNGFNDGTLRSAIRLANDTPGADTVVFDLPGDGPHVINTTFPLVLNSDVEILNDRAGDENVTVRRGTTSNDPSVQFRIFTVEGGSTVLLAGLTITNGYVDRPDANQGGAIYSQNSAVTIRNCTITGNFAGDAGGAIFSVAANANTALTVINSTLSNNSTDGVGGAILSWTFANRGRLTMIGCTLSGNNAGLTGGAIDQLAAVGRRSRGRPDQLHFQRQPRRRNRRWP